MSAKICDFVAYRAAHPGSAVRVQVHYAPLWPIQFWMAFWGEVMGLGFSEVGDYTKGEQQ